MKKKAILFIHGFVGNPDDFKVLDGFFKGMGFETHSFLLSGHFENIKKDVTLQDWIQDCINNIELLKTNGFKKIIIVGHSMGGVLATIIASKYPKTIERIILINPAFEYLVMEKGKIKTIPSFKQALKIIDDVKGKIETIAKIKKYPIPPVNEFFDLVKNHGNDIYNIKCPILFLQGEDDHVVPPNSIKNIYDKIDNKNKSFLIVKNAKHWFLSERIDEEVFDYLENFVNDNKPTLFEKIFYRRKRNI